MKILIPWDNYSGWFEVDCWHCIWGVISTYEGYPDECCNCNGSGLVAFHKKSGCFAKWPGGPFLGKLSRKQRSL